MTLLILGSTGFLGQAVTAAARSTGREVLGAARSAGAEGLAVDLSPAGAAAALLAARAPRAVVLLAAVPDIAPAREDPEGATRLNAEVPGEVAAWCARSGARLVHVSSDQVFDGSRGAWREEAPTRPLHHYGATKRAGERAVLERLPGAAVVRVALMTGVAPAGRRSATTSLLGALDRAAAGGPRPGMFTDEVRSPVAVSDVARALLELVDQDEVGGLLHCGGPRALSRHDLALEEARAHGRDPGLVGTATREELGLAHERPADLSLDSSRLRAVLGWTPRTMA